MDEKINSHKGLLFFAIAVTAWWLMWLIEYLLAGYILMKHGTQIVGNQALLCLVSMGGIGVITWFKYFSVRKR